MPILQRFTIRTKLGALMAAMLLVNVAVGAFAIERLGEVHQKTAYLAEQVLPGTAALGELDASAAHYRRLMQQHIIAPDSASKAVIEGRLTEHAAEVETLRARYEPLIHTEAGRAKFAAAMSAWKTYREAGRHLTELSRAGMSAEAGRYSLEIHRPMGQTLETAIDGLMVHQTALGAAAAREADDTYGLAWRLILAVGVLAPVAGMLAAFSLARAINTAMARVTEPMRQLAGGDLSVHIPYRGQPTEVGAIADALQVFKDALIAKQGADEGALAEAAFKADRALRLEALTAEFESKVGVLTEGLNAAAAQMNATARGLTATASDASHRTVATAAATEEASANVQTVAGAADQLSGSIREIAEQVALAAGIAGRAVGEAQATDATVQDLAQAAGRIGEVVSFISSIASQTNLLALNATIEAARAGDAGRGFAVVASEVKALANQTAKATEDISAQIGAIQQSTEGAVGAIGRIRRTVGEMGEIASAIAAAVEEQRAATAEIARNVQEAASGTAEVAGNVTALEQSAAGTGKVAGKVLTAAGELADQSAALQREVGEFLRGVKAA